MNEIVYLNNGTGKLGLSSGTTNYVEIFQQYVVNDNTMAYIKLDNNVLDSSGNNYHFNQTGLTYYNNTKVPIFDKCGYFHSGVTVLAQNYASGFTSGITISCWICLSGSSAQYAGIVVDRGYYNANTTGFLKFSNAITVKSYVTGTAVTVGDVYDNLWHHLVVTYNGSNAYSYLDGVQYGPIAKTGPIILTGAGFRIGGDGWSTYANTRNSIGYIDEVIIEKVAWSSSDVLFYYKKIKGI